MKNSFITFLSLLFIVTQITNLQAQRTCNHESHMNTLIQNHEYAAQHQERQNKFEIVHQNNPNLERAQCASPVTLPMAVHYQGLSAGYDEACLTALAIDQIRILNEDYGGYNADISTWVNNASQYYNSSNGETCIAFCLATQNHPSGFGLTNGSPAVTFNTTSGDSNSNWSGYINIWVRANTGVLGYSPLGGSGAGDGVVIDANAFGSGAGCTGVVPGAPYNLGRTLTHELGHYLNLDHIWGGGCSQDDGVSDTPSQSASNGGCPTLGNTTSCNTEDMHMNYMDYTNDACMYMFSAGQSTRMENYVTANLQNVVNNYANVCNGTPPPSCTDNEVMITITFDNYPEETSWSLKSGNTTVASGGTYGSQADGSTLTITECLANGCYDFTIADAYGDGICCSYGNGSYSLVSGGTTLASGGSFGASETTNICLGNSPAPTCTDGIQNGNETGVDCGGSCDACPVPGCTDSNAHNYDSNATVDNGSCETCNDGIQNGDETAVDCGGAKCDACPCNDVNITINFDNYPEETSWTLKSGSTTVASGGTYGSQADGSTLTITECLPAGCYDFTITDAYGDGICCGYGNGSYTVTNGAGTTLASGGSFGASETTNICLTNAVTTLGKDESVELNDIITNEISIFPNPTKDILNVSFSADSKDISISIYNQLGQILKTQNVAGGTKTTQLQVADLTPGNYFINIIVDGKRTVEKFVKY